MRVKACVLTYREVEMAVRCLESLRFIEAREIFFNGSDYQAESGFFIEGVQVLSSDENLAFAEVVNRAIERAGGFDLLMFVTNDVTFQPGSVERLINFLQENSQAGLLGPVQLQPSGEVHHLGGEFNRERWSAEVETDGVEEILGFQKRVWIDGGAMVIRLDAAKEVGSLRADYGFYWEDVDWGMRFEECGWEVGVLGTAVALHEKSPTIGKFGRWKKYLIARNRALSARLNLDGAEFERVSKYLKRSAFLKMVKKGFREEGLVYRAAIRDGLAGNVEYMNQPIADDDPKWRDVF